MSLIGSTSFDFAQNTIHDSKNNVLKSNLRKMSQNNVNFQLEIATFPTKYLILFFFTFFTLIFKLVMLKSNCASFLEIFTTNAI